MVTAPTAAPRAARIRALRTENLHFLRDLGIQVSLLFIISLLAALLGAGVARAQEQPAEVPEPEPAEEAAPIEFEAADEPLPSSRDSLLSAIESYSRQIAVLKDSLGTNLPDIQLDETHRERLQDSISEFTTLIEDIGQELSRMDFEISENRVSLTDEFGEGIVINIPENLDERLSEGMQALSQMILEELPDSTGAVFGLGTGLDISALFPGQREPERKIIQGNVVKVSDDVHITPEEDLRGSLVVVMGDAVVSGRVDGDVVAVLGNVLLDEDCEVTGRVVCVLGRLDRAPSAEVGDLVVVDPWPSGGNLLGGWDRWGEGLTVFLVSQSLFLVLLIVAVVVVVMTPHGRLERILSTVRVGPLQSLGAGALASFGLAIITVVLMVILILTIVGIPLALLLAVGLGLLAVLAVAVSGAALGERLCGLLSRECASLWLAVVVGLLVLHSVSFLGGVLGAMIGTGGFAMALLVLGWCIKSLAFFVGVGAMVRSQAWRRKLS